VLGDTLVLWCNTTQSSGVEWTINGTDGILRYIFVNGSITDYVNFPVTYSVLGTSKGEFSLRIYNIYPTYSGFYDCYETDGRRIVGYYVVAEGMFLNIVVPRAQSSYQ